jgi:hypothetical protein
LSAWTKAAVLSRNGRQEPALHDSKPMFDRMEKSFECDVIIWVKVDGKA